ncbi:MAG: 4-(cytidine 5'-diphospho)-2-C-methyl-D-erythritol kinase [Clostridiales bacterium]|nr:4-(cytidine 5'-diphospho)-2-C-methyl-D-erythritol kinase [Clostridiales bacterium]
MNEQIAKQKGVNELIIYAPAKINLFLDVLSKRADGYHEIDTIMAPVHLFDKITVQETVGYGTINVFCDVDTIPQGEKNIAYKSAKAIYQKLNKKNYHTNIIIEKRIPSAAGLAGGSADAAAVIKAINQINNSCLSTETLLQIGKHIGADVPFCIMNQTMRAGGIGDKLTPTSALPFCWFIIAQDGAGIETKKAYQEIDQLEKKQSPNINHLLAAINAKELSQIGKYVYNIFEEIVFPQRPAAAALKEFFITHGCLFSLMSGSGTAVYAAYATKQEALDAAKELKHKNCPNVFVCESIE